MGFDASTLDSTAQLFRAEMWSSPCDDALEDCGIAERHFGPLQGNVIEDLYDTPALNTILGAGEPGAVSGGHLAEAVEWADDLGIDYQVLVGRDRPESRPAERWLSKSGFEQGSKLIRYARDAMRLPDLPGVGGVKVWEIGEEGEEGIAGETMVFEAAPALGLPDAASNLLFELPGREHWRCYTAEVDADLVGFGSMLIRDGIAMIGLDGTAERARRRGCNLALLRQRLVDAFEAGCETVVASVYSYGDRTPPRARNLIRAGFAPVHSGVNWQRPRA